MKVAYTIVAASTLFAAVSQAQFPSPEEIVKRMQAELEAKPPFEPQRWEKLSVGMKPADVFAALGTPYSFSWYRGSDGSVQHIWVYLYDQGKTEVWAKFGSTVTALPVNFNSVTVTPREFDAWMNKTSGDFSAWTIQTQASHSDIKK